MVNNYEHGVKKNKLFVLAGPCSAESEKQLLSTASVLKSLKKVNVFRAGIWKVRTKSDAFQGVGEQGLVWLKNIQQELNFPVATEVITPLHVELCLKHNVNIMWVGTRTTVNSYLINEIAHALKNVDNILLLIKNPINPDLSLWSGIIDRFLSCGIGNIIAVHRGFSVYNYKIYRNNPIWDIPIQLKKRYPYIPIICDPSHITGKAEKVLKISTKAIKLGFSGLMIESHINPTEALSDSYQQVTPLQLKEILRLISKYLLPYERSNILLPNFTRPALVAQD